MTTARATGLPDVLLAAANSSGGVIGKAVSPQNLAIAAVAVGMSGREGDLFRRVAGWTALMLAVLSLLVFLQSTPVLALMLPLPMPFPSFPTALARSTGCACSIFRAWCAATC